MASTMTHTARSDERRRAAALALHYRDTEKLSVKEIAHRMGKAESTVANYLWDSDGSKQRARRDTYRGTCRYCGAATSAGDGKNRSRPYCAQHKELGKSRTWTKETAREALLDFKRRNGFQPTTYDLELAKAKKRGGAALKRLTARPYPRPGTLRRLWGSTAACFADVFGQPATAETTT